VISAAGGGFAARERFGGADSAWGRPAFRVEVRLAFMVEEWTPNVPFGGRSASVRVSVERRSKRGLRVCIFCFVRDWKMRDWEKEVEI